MATETHTDTAPPAPELTVLTRVASIPLISESVSSLLTTLAQNPYTASPYTKAADISKAAYATAQPYYTAYGEPLTVRLAPLISRADGIANKSLDAVESRYPYPFTTTTEGLVTDLKTQRDQAVGAANKTIDERVKTPAYQLADGIDRRFSPIVDRLESAVNMFHGHSSTPSTSSAASDSSEASSSSSASEKYQYQRAYRLSKELTDSFYVYSNEQIKQLQTQSILVQRATETAQSLNNLAASSYGAAQTRVHGLSDTMVQELHKLQASTSTLPAHLQSSFHDVSEGVSATITDLSATLKNSELTLNEKASRVRSTVSEKLQPMLELASVKIQEALNAVVRRQPVERTSEGEDEEEPESPVRGSD